jgi:SAM-dependent methyltransferase
VRTGEGSNLLVRRQVREEVLVRVIVKMRLRDRRLWVRIPPVRPIRSFEGHPSGGTVTTPRFDRSFWEERWSEVLRDHGDLVAQRPPNVHLTAEALHFASGVALDAGCGHGSDTFWLAARGWRVTAVDFSTAALTHARSTAESLGRDVAERIDWVEDDLSIWTPSPERFDLVVSLYVHVAGSVEEMVARLAAGVAPGGTLFLVGHRPIDPVTGTETAAAGQVQVSVDDAVAALDPDRWDLVIAEDRPRAMAGTGVDAVVSARRRD